MYISIGGLLFLLILTFLISSVIGMNYAEKIYIKHYNLPLPDADNDPSGNDNIKRDHWTYM